MPGVVVMATVSRPSVPKFASFLLYLCRSLSLSFSSIASYRSMLSGVFRFVLPELSSRSVLRDLLRFFSLERPVSSSCVPPWDLSRVRSFLRGPPFEPLSSFPLRELTWKVYFLLALATARRVSELHVVSSVVSFSADGMYLFFLPEFQAESESEVRPFPHSFRFCWFPSSLSGEGSPVVSRPYSLSPFSSSFPLCVFLCFFSFSL